MDLRFTGNVQLHLIIFHHYEYLSELLVKIRRWRNIVINKKKRRIGMTASIEQWSDRSSSLVNVRSISLFVPRRVTRLFSSAVEFATGVSRPRTGLANRKRFLLESLEANSVSETSRCSRRIRSINSWQGSILEKRRK